MHEHHWILVSIQSSAVGGSIDQAKQQGADEKNPGGHGDCCDDSQPGAVDRLRLAINSSDP